MRTWVVPTTAWLCAVLITGSPLVAQEKIEAVTKPSQDVVLSFVRPGQVMEVLVKEGDSVKVNQELIRLDDKAEQAQVASLKAEADDDTRVRAADAQLAQRRVDLKKTEQAHKEGAATELEVEHAKLDVTISDLSLRLAEFERKQARMKLDEAKIQIERMRLRSPIDGVVERLLVEPGESADSLEKIAQVVRTDPLWIDVPVPLTLAHSLKKNVDSAAVEFDGKNPARKVVQTGKIIHIAAVADSASGTLTVRVECPNPKRRPAGEHVYVSFPSLAAQAPSAPARPLAHAAPNE